MLYTLKHFTAESRLGIPCKLEFLSQLLIDVHVLILLLVLAQTSRAVEKSCYRVEVLKFVHLLPMQRFLSSKISDKNSRTSPPFHSATMCDLATKFSGKLVIFSVSFNPHPFLPDQYTVLLLYHFSLIHSGFDSERKSFLMFEHVFDVTCYCAFHKHANFEVQKPTDDCVFRCRQSS